MNPMLNIAIRASRQAGNIITKYYETADSTEFKQKSNYDLTNFVERKAKRQIIDIIFKSYPDHIIITENDSQIYQKTEKVQWIINALDDNVNYIKRLPHFSVSIAARVKGRSEIAVVYDPMRNELFYAWRGHGTQLNGYRLRGSSLRYLSEALLSTNTILTKHKSNTYDMNACDKLLYKCANFRCSGSVALDLAYVASGRLDGYYAMNLKPRDFTAGDLLIREAGGLVTDFSGDNNYFFSGNIIAGNARIVQSMLTQIRPRQ
ncbi:inositol-1-monophosphatase [Candidatus Erwinia haradaeae]|uniref:Inositol-1-monophosphatase n=1 Tax=Candidatus Erwinia haradaeae TaxID=1922217 RepID=A0A451DIE9_9GAMM|nr:inositol-1-monophosphatase [Candidatus Erwinia haradaeae]VFP86442.1 Inositol-1-monophosphatase [Candidatus Erwinia haradaeae]